MCEMAEVWVISGRGRRAFGSGKSRAFSCALSVFPQCCSHSRYCLAAAGAAVIRGKFFSLFQWLAGAAESENEWRYSSGGEMASSKVLSYLNGSESWVSI